MNGSNRVSRTAPPSPGMAPTTVPSRVPTNRRSIPCSVPREVRPSSRLCNIAVSKSGRLFRLPRPSSGGLEQVGEQGLLGQGGVGRRAELLSGLVSGIQACLLGRSERARVLHGLGERRAQRSQLGGWHPR